MPGSGRGIEGLIDTSAHAAIRAFDVADHLADECRASVDGGQPMTPSPPDKFLYVFKTGPSRARKRAATAGRAACPPLRFAALWARPLAWRARANRVPGRRQQNSPSTIDTLSMCTRSNGRLPPARGRRGLPADRGLPHRPASNHGKGRSGTARVKGAYGVPAIEHLDP